MTGLGFATPRNRVASAELSEKVRRSEDWILSRTGVAARYYAEETMPVLGARAGREAIADGPPPDLVINASASPVQLIPDSSVFIQRELGYSGIPSFTMNATCLSFLVAAHTAISLISAGAYERILIVSSETGSSSLNYDEPESAVLIGDGAAAAMISRADGESASKLLGFKMRTWPEGAHLTEVRGGGTRCHPNNPATQFTDNLFTMQGPRTYRMARKRAGDLIDEALSDQGMTVDDVDLVVPHQMSGPGIAAVADHGFGAEKVVSIVSEYGNCIAASMPMALYKADQQGRLQKGMNVLMMGIGAGLSVAVAIIEW